MSIVDNMQNHIEYNNVEYKILNPVMQEGNFADKWNEKPQKADNFFRWLTTVKKDILESPLKLSGIDEIGEVFKQCLGEKPVNRALNKYGEELKKLDDPDFTHNYGVDVAKKKVEICLYRYKEFTYSMILSNTVIPWAIEWLFYYEIWLATGEWQGGGEHPEI